MGSEGQEQSCRSTRGGRHWIASSMVAQEACAQQEQQELGWRVARRGKMEKQCAEVRQRGAETAELNDLWNVKTVKRRGKSLGYSRNTLCVEGLKRVPQGCCIHWEP